jgi:hypothetical protein
MNSVLGWGMNNSLLVDRNQYRWEEVVANQWLPFLTTLVLIKISCPLVEDAKDGLVSILTEGRFHYTVLVSPRLRIAIPMMDRKSDSKALRR